METERLFLDSIKESDKEDYFINISHDKKVLETFICRYEETLEDFDFSSYPGRPDLFAVRLKETGRLIGIVNYFDEKEGSCEIGYGIGLLGLRLCHRSGQAFSQIPVYRRGLIYRLCVLLHRERRLSPCHGKSGMAYDHFSEKELTYLGVERDLTYYAIHRASKRSC